MMDNVHRIIEKKPETESDLWPHK